MTNQKFRGGSTNKIDDFICLYSGNRESIEIDFHLLKATRNLEKRKGEEGLKELPHLDFLKVTVSFFIERNNSDGVGEECSLTPRPTVRCYRVICF